MKRLLQFLIFISIYLCLCSCHNQITLSQPVTLIADPSCIGSFDDFAITTPNIDGPEQAEILPGKQWEIVSELPKEIQSQENTIAAVRGNKGKIEIWLKPYKQVGAIPEDKIPTYSYWIFKTESALWEKIPSQIEESDSLVDQLFVTRKGQIWGRNVGIGSQNSLSLPILSKFNEESRRFESVNITGNIPYGKRNSIEDAGLIFYQDTILLDKNDIFWIFPEKDSIFEFDSRSLQIKKHISTDPYSRIDQAVEAQDGSIYLLAQQNEYELTDGQIYQYLPRLEKISPIELPSVKWPAPNSIIVDHKDRLWVGAFGWMDQEGKWQLLNPESGKFLQLNKYLPLWRYYQPPSVLLETSDGRIWFGIPRSGEWKTLRSGLAWYDPETNRGCWFTSEGFNVMEDNAHSIWAITNKNLYRSIQ